MTYSLSIEGFPELMQQLTDIAFEADSSIARTLNFVAQSTAQRAKNRIRSGGRSGRTYLIDGRIHQASAPGEPPANLTGALANSIRFTKITDRLTSSATAGSDLSYAATLEFGGWSDFDGEPVYIEARPFLLPSFEEAIIGVENRLKAEFEKGRR